MLRLLLLISVLTLSACATLPVSTNTHLNQHGLEIEEYAQCTQPDRLPSKLCSDTVTATFDSDGMLWVVWVDRQRIYLQSSSDQGINFSTPVAVNAQPEAVIAQGEYRPKIKLDQQGNLYISWTQSLEKRHSGYIRFSRSTDGGRHFSEPVTINDNQEIIGHRFDAMAIGQNGEIFIAWLDARDKEHAKAANQDFHGTAVYYAWSNDGGKSFYPNKLMAAHSCECCRLGVEIDTDNLPVVLWRQVFDGGIRDHALLKFVDWNTPGQIHRVDYENWKIDACPHHGPALSISDGVYHAVWFSGAANQSGLFYGRSKGTDLAFTSVYHFGQQGAKHPNVLALGQRVAITWQEYDGQNSLLKFMQSDDGGVSWSQPVSLAKEGEHADDAFLLADGDSLYVSWQTRNAYRLIAVDADYE